MKSYMDQMDEELAQTSIGESFEKVNIFLISSIAVVLWTRKADNHSQSVYDGKLCNKPVKTQDKYV